MFKRIKYQYLLLAAFILAGPAYAVLPNIFATQPAGNVQASTLDTNFTFLEAQGVQGLTTTGSSNAYVATPADAWVTGYSAYVGRALTVKPSFTNTGAATFNVSGLGGASIYKNVLQVQTALASGDIVSGTPAILICDGSGFLLANPTSGSGPSPPSAAATTYTGSASALNNAVLANVTGMQQTLTAGKTYLIDAWGVVTAGNIGQGYQIGLNGTATVTSFNGGGYIDNNGTFVGGFNTSSLGAVIVKTAVAVPSTFYIHGYIVVNAGGTINLQFAQNVSGGTSSDLGLAVMNIKQLN